ncbi:hypothetical protein [Bifidobacterium coryneforme]|nr:hypothetical protein [Bifidobacterium coryneforme]
MEIEPPLHRLVSQPVPAILLRSGLKWAIDNQTLVERHPLRPA